MLPFASDLYQNALNQGWAGARGAYKVIMTEMEAGRVSWEELNTIQDLRRQYAQRFISKPATGYSPTGPSNGPLKGNSLKQADKGNRLACPAYQTASCTHSADHTVNGVRYRHICAYCLAVTKVIWFV